MRYRRPPALTAALKTIDTRIGARLRQQRNLAGMSQERLGKHTGVSFQQIQKYERGVNGVDASNLYLLAHILNIPVIWFYEGITLDIFENSEAAPKLPGLEDDVLGRRETLELIRAYYQLPDQIRRSFYNLLKSMAGSSCGEPDSAG